MTGSTATAADQQVNIFLETSGVLDRSKIPAAIEAVSFNRVLFGSGFPNLDPAAGFGLLEDSELTPSDKRHILFDNAARLFKLNEIEAA